MPNRNFWWYVMREHRMDAVLSDPANALLWEWRPEHANCPELNHEVLALASVCPPEWREVVRSVFVGRTLDGDLNAGADQRGGSAWVSISLQVTSVVGAYIAAHDRLTALLVLLQSGEAVPDAEIARVFEHIALSRQGWADPSRYVGAHSVVLSGPHGRDEEYYSDRVTDAEMFAICHEFAHHLLGHTGASPKRLNVEWQLQPVLRAAGMHDFVYDRPEAQRRELLADVLGLRLACLPRREDAVRLIYSTMIGSICVLLAEADVKDHWMLDDPDGHPSTLDRIELLLAAMPHLLDAASLTGVDSVDGLRAQLAMYASACVQASLNPADPRTYPAPTWAQLAQSGRGRRVAVETTAEDAGDATE